MKPSKKIDARLNARVKAWESLKGGRHELKVQLRIDSGGYKCPGSRKLKSK